MHRNRTWTLDPPEWRTQRNRLLPIEGGDGSTLNLDFTKGVLDSRLTFSRLGTATFVNSQGYVEYAGANLISNSGLSVTAGPAPTSWTGTGNYDGTSVAGVTTIATGVTAQSKYIQTTISVSPGITYSVSILISAVSGQHNTNTMTPTGTAVVSQYYLNGTPVGKFDTAIPGLLTAVFTVSSGTTNDIRIGIGATGSAVANANCIFSLPRCVPGNFPQPVYIASPIDKAYHAPRFDYDPTTIGEPKGLLIEGQAATINNYGEAFDNAAWTASQINKTGMTTSQTDPAGGTNARILKADANAGRHAIYQIPGSTTNPGTGTLTVWAKSKELSFATLQLANAFESKTATVTFDLTTGESSGSVTTSMTIIEANAVKFRDGWWRLRLTATLTVGASPDDRMMPWIGLANASGSAGRSFTASGSGIYIWGAQLEAGSGASSYIPTGASTVLREKESCVMTGTNFSSWFAGATEGVLFAEYEKQRSQSGNTAHDFAAVGSRYNTGEGLILYHANGNAYPTNILWTTNGALFAGGIAASIPLVTRQAARWFGANDITMYSNGIAGTTTAGTGTVTPAMLCFGANSNTGTEATRDWLNSCIRKVKFYPTALSDAAIKALTAPDYVAPTLDLNFLSMSSNTDLINSGLTFGRLSNATFVNAQGYVQYADANEIKNSTMLTASNFTQTMTGGSPSATINGNNTVTLASVVGVATWLQGISIVQGLPSSFSIEVTALNNTDIRVSDMFASAFGFTGQTYYHTNTSGVTSPINSLAVVSAVGLYTVTATTTGTYGNLIFGTGCNGFSKTGSITFARPQFQYGTVVPRTTYVPNTSTGFSKYDSPRFDNKILTSRTNLILQSNNFTIAAGTPWAQKNGTHSVTLTADTAPPGLSGTATRITSSNAAAGITQALNVPLVAGNTIRISFYAKSNTVTTQNCMLQSSSSTSAVLTIPTTWIRIDEIGPVALTELTLKGFIEPLDISIYGMQVEYVTSGGATAYIPTTTTQVTVNTTEPRGLLIEGQTSNIIRYSSAPQSWVAAVSGTTITDGSGLAPDNSSTPKQLAMTSGGYCYQVTQANQAAGTYTFSVWLKASSTQSVGIRISRTGDGSVKGMITAAVTTTWTRFQVQITSNATDTIDCGFDQRSLPPSVPGPAVAATFLMWGAQLVQTYLDICISVMNRVLQIQIYLSGAHN